MTIFVPKKVKFGAENLSVWEIFGTKIDTLNTHNLFRRKLQLSVGKLQLSARLVFLTRDAGGTVHCDIRNCAMEIITSAQYLYTVSHKNVPLNFCLYLCQILTDFKNAFTGPLCGQFAITRLLNIPLHHNCVVMLPCEIYIFKNHYSQNKNMHKLIF